MTMTKAAALRHGKAQVGEVHQMNSGPNGHGYLTWDARREVWMQPYTTTSRAYAVKSRARWIRMHAQAALTSGTTDTTADIYRAALDAAQQNAD